MNKCCQPGQCGPIKPQVKGYLVAALLMLLKRSEAHGYRLIEELEALDYMIDLPDAGVIYRHLRKMEKLNMITSKLEAGGGGPARKVYMITEEGSECLTQWQTGLSDLKRSIDGLLEDLKKGIT